MSRVFYADQVRRAEQPLLSAESAPDQLMRAAATAVAEQAQEMIRLMENPDLTPGLRGSIPAGPLHPSRMGPPATAPGTVFPSMEVSAAGSGERSRHLHSLPGLIDESPRRNRILVVAGSGGNGGDALYAGAQLRQQGRMVDAILVNRSVHKAALDAFESAGGTVLGWARTDQSANDETETHHATETAHPSPALKKLVEHLYSYCLVLDGVVGLGSSGPLRREAAIVFGLVEAVDAPVLAVDIPSGVHADSGQAFPGTIAADAEVATLYNDAGLATPRYLPGHVNAFVSVTFGAMRLCHALSDACGHVVVSDIGLPWEALRDRVAPHRNSLRQTLEATPVTWEYPRVTGEHAIFGRYTREIDLQPGHADNKYSGGVVAICAGSVQYPGAGILATSAAVRATNSMVRYVGGDPAPIISAHPEVVPAPQLAEALSRSQCFVVGPGRGTDEHAHQELAEVLSFANDDGSLAGLVLDADAITLLAQHADLREQLRVRGQKIRSGVLPRRGEAAPWSDDIVLTPHLGECKRLVDAINEHDKPHQPIPDPNDDPLHAAIALARWLSVTVLLKGYRTIVAGARGNMIEQVPEIEAHIIEAGTSWAATAGSGDVLSGLLGAHLAWLGNAFDAAVLATVIHAQAAELAARTAYGYAPTSASLISAQLRNATSMVLNR